MGVETSNMTDIEIKTISQCIELQMKIDLEKYGSEIKPKKDNPDKVKEKLGLVDEEPAQTEQVIQPAQPQEIIINMPEQKKDTVVKKVYVKPPPPKKTETEKRKDEGFDW